MDYLEISKPHKVLFLLCTYRYNNKYVNLVEYSWLKRLFALSPYISQYFIMRIILGLSIYM